MNNSTTYLTASLVIHPPKKLKMFAAQVESNAPAYHQWHSKFPSQSKKWYHISYNVIAGCSSPKMIFNSAFENKNSWIQIELNVEIGSLPPTQGIYEMPHPPSPTPPPPKKKNPCKLFYQEFYEFQIS